MTEKLKHPNLAAALAAFQADLPHVGKGSINPHFKSKYADLADVVSAVLPKLAAQGLAWVTMPTMLDGSFVLAYRLVHEGGESIEGSYPLGQGNAQQRGSEITYARRYTLAAVTGIAPDEDDDGNAAARAPQAPARDWNGEVRALADAKDAAGLKALWRDAQAAKAPSDFLDSIRNLVAAIEAEAPAS